VLESIGRGCSIIKGNLEIRIYDDVNNLTAELQTYLGDVEEIHGNLKIHR
jgi:Receptor L domain